MTNTRVPAQQRPRPGGGSEATPDDELAFWHGDGFAVSPREKHLVRSSSESESVNIAALTGVLRRHWLLIVSATVLLMVISTFVVLQMSPRYSAQAFLMLDTRKTQVVNIEAVMSGLSTDTAVMRSEVDVMSSPMLAGRVVDSLHLADNPQFNRSLTAPGMATWQTSFCNWLFGHARQWLPTEWLNYLPIDGTLRNTNSNSVFGRSLTLSQKRQQLIEALLARLTIANDGKSYGIRLTFEWEDPEIATDVVNTLAQLYIADQIEAKGDATRHANSWLKERLGELRDVVRKSDMEVQLYRTQHHIFQGGQKGTTVAQQQLSELQTQLVLAMVEDVQKESAMRSRSSGTSMDTAVLSSPLIQQLRAQEAEVARKEAAVRTAYGDRYPELIAMTTQLQNLRQSIQIESAKLARASTSDVTSLKARVAQLREAVAIAEHTAADENAANVRLNELEREAEADQNLFKSFLARYLETSKQENLQSPDARIISLATVPTRPAFPNTKLFLGIATGFSILVGISLAFVVEHFDPTFRRLDQLPATGFPGLGILPIVRGAKRRPTRVVDTIVDNPASAYSESVRGIRNVLHMSADRRPQTILITSAAPGEGKTLFAVSAARSLVSSGRRVLLIDCDLRRPGVGKILNGPRQVDLQSVARGSLDLNSAVQVDEMTGLHYIASAKADLKSGSYIDFIDSDQFAGFLNMAKANYDAIIIDSPPMQVVSDAIVLARYADAAVFLVRCGRTRRSVAIAAMERLALTGVTLSGIVLSQVNLRKHRQDLQMSTGMIYGHYHEHDRPRYRLGA